MREACASTALGQGRVRRGPIGSTPQHVAAAITQMIEDAVCP